MCLGVNPRKALLATDNVDQKLFDSDYLARKVLLATDNMNHRSGTVVTDASFCPNQSIAITEPSPMIALSKLICYKFFFSLKSIQKFINYLSINPNISADKEFYF